MKMKTVAAAAALMVAPAVTFAAAPTLSEVLAASGITVSGAVDVSYDWADIDGPQSTPAAPFVNNRQFDVGNDTFSLHQVNLLISKDFGNGVGITANTIMGDDAAITSPNGDNFDLFQAFVSYNTGALTVIGGRFATLAGYEVVNPAGNVNASRSMLFFNQPFVHTGVRATYKISDVVAVTAGVNNAGFGNGKTDTNSDATIEAQLALTPSSAFSAYLTGYSGDGDGSPTGTTGDKQRADYVDLVINLNVADALSFGINADYANTEGALAGSVDFRGVAFYTNVKPSDKLRFSLRGEYLEFDTAAAATKRNYLRGVTLTTAYSLSPNLDMLFEVRSDKGSENGSFNDRDANIAGINDDVNTATIKAIAKF